MNCANGAKFKKQREIDVVMISGQYMPETFGGAQQQCDKLSRGLTRRGMNVAIFTNRCSLKLPAVESHNGVSIFRPYTLFPPQPMGKYILISLLWLVQWLYWLLIRKGAVNCLHAHQAKFQAYLACIGGVVLDKPVIVKLGNAGEHDDLARMRTKFLVGEYIYRFILKHTTVFVAISSDIARELRGHGVREDRIMLIPNGVEQSFSPQELQAERRHARTKLAPNFTPEVRLFVFAGRLEPVKNLNLLITAFARWQKEPGARASRLWIIGDGPERQSLEELVQVEGVANLVSFLGYVDGIRNHLLAADFLAMSSVAEGMSNSLLEGMAVGLVPIFTPVSGATDLISDGKTGFLSASISVNDYSRALARAGSLDDDGLKIFSQRNFDRIEQSYTIERVASSYVSLYERLRFQSQ